MAAAATGQHRLPPAHLQSQIFQIFPFLISAKSIPRNSITIIIISYVVSEKIDEKKEGYKVLLSLLRYEK